MNFAKTTLLIFLLLLVFQASMPYSQNSKPAAGLAMQGNQAIPVGADLPNMSFYSKLNSKLGIDLATVDAQTIKALTESKMIIVSGSTLDAAEKTAIAAVKGSYPMLADAKIFGDKEISVKDIESGKYVVVLLIGGPSQNKLSQEAVSKGWIGEREEAYGQFMAQNGVLENGTLVIILSDKRGFENAPRESVKYSPLSLIVPTEYVPVAATGVSVFLLILMAVGKKVLEGKIQEVGKKKMVIDSKTPSHLRMALEAAAISGSSIILALSLTWQYFGLSGAFVFWLIINLFISLFTEAIHEVAHRIFGFLFKINVEYKFWPAGSALTIFSSFLGNAFSAQGFLIEEIPESVSKWKVAVMKMAGPALSTAIMVVFASINAIFPSTYFQMIYTASALIAVAEVFPFDGLDGKDVLEWNFFVWLFMFMIVCALYGIVTFIL